MVCVVRSWICMFQLYVISNTVLYTQAYYVINCTIYNWDKNIHINALVAKYRPIYIGLYTNSKGNTAIFPYRSYNRLTTIYVLYYVYVWYIIGFQYYNVFLDFNPPSLYSYPFHSILILTIELSVTLFHLCINLLFTFDLASDLKNTVSFEILFFMHIVFTNY